MRLFNRKKDGEKYLPNDNIYTVLARRKWITPQYIYGSCITKINKNATPIEVCKKIYEASINAANVTKAKTAKLAKLFITH